jgi:hypothetical protein
LRDFDEIEEWREDSSIYQSNLLKRFNRLICCAQESDVVKAIKAANGQVIKLPANTTSMLQPLDRSPCFVELHKLVAEPTKLLLQPGPRKAWQDKVLASLQTILPSKAEVNKLLEVYHVLFNVVAEAFRSLHLSSAFSKLGMVPERWELRKVLEAYPFAISPEDMDRLVAYSESSVVRNEILQTGRVSEATMEAAENVKIGQATRGRPTSLLDSKPVAQQRALLLTHPDFVRRAVAKRTELLQQSEKKAAKKEFEVKKRETKNNVATQLLDAHAQIREMQKQLNDAQKQLKGAKKQLKEMNKNDNKGIDTNVCNNNNNSNKLDGGDIDRMNINYRRNSTKIPLHTEQPKKKRRTALAKICSNIKK